MLHGETSKKWMRIKAHEFTDHPIRVRTDPDSDGQVMAKFRNVLTGSPGDDNRNDKRWEDH